MQRRSFAVAKAAPMLSDYRAWLESELELLGNASHHAYAFGQANMAKRAIERLDEDLAKAPTAEEIAAAKAALEELRARDGELPAALETLAAKL
jgi:hypothetical protein